MKLLIWTHLPQFSYIRSHREKILIQTSSKYFTHQDINKDLNKMINFTATNKSLESALQTDQLKFFGFCTTLGVMIDSLTNLMKTMKTII